MPAAQGHARRREEGRDRRDRILVDVGEDHRGHEGDEHPADEPAGRDQEVEAGEVGGGRAEPRQRPVAVEGGEGEDEEVDQAEREHGTVGEVQDHQRDQGRGQEAGDEPLRDEGPAREGVDEGGEVYAKGHDPQQRHRRHVGGEVARDPEQERARNRRQGEDAHHRQAPRRPRGAPA